MKVVILGLSITSSWGNGHATTYRALARALAQRGHEIIFLERDVPWYARERDLPVPPFCTAHLYASLEELRDTHQTLITSADLVIVGSYVPQGVEVIDWVLNHARGVVAFYDIDTPVTMAKLDHKDFEYLEPRQISQFDYYLSFTGGPLLQHIQKTYGAKRAEALYCSVDPTLYYKSDSSILWDLGYLGTYSDDRQPELEELLLRTARTGWGDYVVAGPQYPPHIGWPENVHRIEHLPPNKHRDFYNSQRFTLNLTRADMRRWGYSPSVRLFEAAACGVPIISDWWPGLDTVFEPDKEIIIVSSHIDVEHMLRHMSEEQRRAIGEAGRNRVLREHTNLHRAGQIEELVEGYAIGSAA